MPDVAAKAPAPSKDDFGDRFNKEFILNLNCLGLGSGFRRGDAGWAPARIVIHRHHNLGSEAADAYALGTAHVVTRGHR